VHRTWLGLWNAFGALDLMLAVLLGVLSAPGAPFRVFIEGAGHAGDDHRAMGLRPGDARSDLFPDPRDDRGKAANCRTSQPLGDGLTTEGSIMQDQALEQTRSAEIATTTTDRTEANRGIGFPRIYDLLLLILTRGRDRAYRADLLDLAGIAPGHDVLDIGCGTGTQAIAAWRRTQPGGSVVGVDISDKMLAVARRKGRRAGLDILFHHADAAELPFEDDRFGVVTITTVMHMVPESRRRICLQEASRVLVPGGRLLLIDYAGDPRDRRHLSAKHGLHRQFDLHSLREPLSEEGFEKIDGGPLNWLSLHFLRGIKRL
jgi:ubiquinone/menaquinone biosynthesis C-methylase UbiE